MAKTDAQLLIERGEQKGRQEGLIAGRRALLRAQLEFKFGPLSPRSVAAAEAIPEQELDAAALRVLNAVSLADIGI